MYLDLGVMDMLAVFASPGLDAEFEGWYDSNGNLLSSDATYSVPDPWSIDELIAVYSGGSEPGILGDVDGNGEVSVADAIIALRASMQLVELSE